MHPYKDQLKFIILVFLQYLYVYVSTYCVPSCYDVSKKILRADHEA